jgi:hypothetical protein
LSPCSIISTIGLDENGIGILPSCSNACVAERGANEILFFAISVSRSVQAGDSRAIQRLMLQVAGTMFLQSYRAGKYYNYDRDGDKIAIDLILNSGMINETIVKICLAHFVENQVLQLLFYG